uniref:ubiquitinyl hydrolase 1 n=1 Tax=Cacopsylla melanoneura TaxID=428564 RepID=A0A8D8Y4L7_9HEMI
MNKLLKQVYWNLPYKSDGPSTSENNVKRCFSSVKEGLTMGARDSKPATITYEDVIKFKRVDEADLNRLREAFRRIAPSSSHISQQVFIREVLGPGVPAPIAKSIFSACGGTTKGISFKDLVCGLILLTKGTISEKHRFLFDIYSEDGEYIHRNEFQKIVYSSESTEVYAAISNLFSEGDKITFDRFRDWIISYPDLMSASRWLLTEVNNLSISHDLESPNFYQTLAGVTHLEEHDIIDLERAYSHLLSKSSSGKLDLASLSPLLSPPVPISVCDSLFAAFDENRDCHIDFKEMACGVSAACRGPLIERQKFCFKVFDKDRDGVLNESEIRHMVHVLLFVRKENLAPDQVERESMDEGSIVSELLKHCENHSPGLTGEEYLIWSVANHALVSHFVNLIFQVCHIVLGLRSSSRQEEGELVSAWLDREVRRGLIVGQYWNLVSMDWWNTWRAYVSGDKTQLETGSGSTGGGGGELTHVETYPLLTKNNSASSFKSFTLGRKSAAASLIGNSLAMDQNDSVITKRVRPLDKPSTHYTHNRTASYHSLNYEPFSPSQSPMLSRRRISKPGPIDNNCLIVPTDTKIPSLTGEGGKLRKNLELSKGREFELIPASLWKVLHSWYGGGPSLPRQVIKHPTSPGLSIEYYPVSLNLYRHVFPGGGVNNASGQWSGGGGGIVAGYGPASSALIGTVSYPYNISPAPKRHIKNTATLSCLATVQQVCDFAAATFHLSRQDVRLWQILNQDQEDNVLLLEDESCTLEDLGIDNENNNILVEVRNKDLTWPEEINKLTTAASLKQVSAVSVPGATGLNNLGNTCFMNAALQCVSNTRALTQYFTRRLHLYELNRSNPLGMRGHIAKRYGDLIDEIWSGTAKTIAPLKLRLTIGKYAPRFNGFQQHDSQEFLSFLLDGLHEDLNRVTDKPYVELKDSDGRPDEEVAREAWENHIIRNKSVIVDLFHGQLKSKVTCLVCKHESVRFDPFNYLSLPLPIETHIHVQVVVIRLDGSIPIKYGLKLGNEETYLGIKTALAGLVPGLGTQRIRLADVKDGIIRSSPADDDKIKSGGQVTPVSTPLYSVSSGSGSLVYSSLLFGYELPSNVGGSLCGDEERSSLGSFKCGGGGGGSIRGDACNFSTIQRTVKPGRTLGTQGVNGTAAVNGETGDMSVQHSQNKPNSVESSTNHQDSSPDNNNSHSRTSSNISDKSVSVNSSSRERTNSQVSINENGHRRHCHTSNGDTKSCSGQCRDKTKTICATGNCPVSCQEEETYDTDTCDSGNCSASSSSLADSTSSVPTSPGNPPLIGYHRKMMRQTAYFLSAHKYRPILFGIPLIVPCPEGTTHQDLYQAVWLQVARLVTPLPPLETIPPNHATDCDDSLGYEYPFVLKAVTPDGLMCSLCPWIKFCLGCKLACDDTEFLYNAASSTHLAIDWDPTALHLRYQSSLEKAFQEHESYIASKREATEPINLDYCLEMFTKEEELGENEKYYCSKCRTHQMASKKLEIYRLPPVLIVHLKRFQYIQNKWVKCQKVVNFPHADFDPTSYLAKVPKTNILRHRRLSERTETSKGWVDENANEKSKSDEDGVTNRSTSSRFSESSLQSAPQDLHQHRLLPGHDPFDLKYRLYGMVCHSGILGGGHYVSYAINPNGSWYAYNDSSCRPVAGTEEMDTTCAYMLFYERKQLDAASYLPDVSDREMKDTKEIDEDYDENEMKKVCRVM